MASKKRGSMTAVALMATPCTKSREVEVGGHKHGGDEGRMLCWTFATIFSLGAGRQSVLMLIRNVF